jgi:AcrR family transcriptional regulator
MTDPPVAEATTWRSLAVSRSVDPARERAESRVQAFLDAAIEILGGGNEDLTVLNVVEHSGQSLRSFYLHFAGKYELLLAVFEESVRAAAESLEAAIEGVDDPVERLRIFVTEYYRICRSGTTHQSDARLPSRAMGNFAHQLLFEHPEEASRSFAPLVSSLEQVLTDAADAGAIRSDLDAEQVAGIVLQAIMFNAFSMTVTGLVSDEMPARGELLWQLLIDGLRTNV